MKQTSFTVKNLEGNLPKKQSTIVKKSLRFRKKTFVLDSTIPKDELTVETFYRNLQHQSLWTFQYMNVPWMIHLQSQSKPLTDSKKFLKKNFTTISLWWLLRLLLLHQTNFKFVLKFLIWWNWENLVTKTLAIQTDCFFLKKNLIIFGS